MVFAMQTIATSADGLRRRIRDAKASMREIARTAGVSNSTVRRFVERGRGNIETVARIEGAVDRLVVPPGGDAASTAVTSNVAQ